jgi:hypothetical protein
MNSGPGMAGIENTTFRMPSMHPFSVRHGATKDVSSEKNLLLLLRGYSRAYDIATRYA